MHQIFEDILNQCHQLNWRINHEEYSDYQKLNSLFLLVIKIY